MREAEWGAMARPKIADEEKPTDATLDPKALEAIGRALKAHYDDLIHTPLPDKFVELLDRLEVEEQRKTSLGRRNAAD
jgi:hypothetical protein